MKAVVLALCVVLSVACVWGWGQEGHEAIAKVASTRLTTAAQSVNIASPGSVHHHLTVSCVGSESLPRWQNA